jgi:lipoprotein
MNRKMLYMIVSITLMISLSACGSVNNKPVSVWQTTGINNSVNSGTNEDNTTNTGSDVISDEDNLLIKLIIIM